MKQRSAGLWLHLGLSCLGLLIVCLLGRGAIAEQASADPQVTKPEWRERLPSQPQVFPSQWEQFKERFDMIGYLDANLSYSRQTNQGSEDVRGGGVSAVLSPVYRPNDRTALILTYDGTYRKELDYYADTVGPVKTTEYMRHTVTPMVQLELGESSRYILVPSFFYTRTYNKDAEGGGLDDGLYNYRDIGGGVDFRMKGLDFGKGRGTLKLGLQYYDRHYPNFNSLLFLATGSNIEKDENDYRGLLGRIGYTWVQNVGFSWGTNYYILYKYYDDNKVVNSNGILTSETRVDYLNNLDLSLWFIPNSQRGLRLGLDLNGNYYNSNENFYDDMGEPGNFDDDVYIKDFYDYYAFLVRPNISYAFQNIPLTATLAYSYGRLKYTDRLAQKENGSYKNSKQWEAEQTVGALLSYAISRHFSVYTQYRYLDATSNNDDSTTFQYDHKVHYFYGGATFRF